MEVRGRRRCTACDTRWSYFETGSIECPDCGGVRSVAVESDRTLHTDGAAPLDLTEARRLLGERPLREVASAARSAAASYCSARGFVDAGVLQPLDDRVVAAAELRTVADHVRHRHAVPEAVEAHFIALLADAPDGARPADVPAALRAARGLAAATVVEAYRRDLRRWLDGAPDPDVSRVLDGLRAHERRVAALDGDVDPAEAAALLEAARALGEALRADDERALNRAAEQLTDLD